MSEAELHVLRARLLGSQRAKASRGELEMRQPVGLVTDPAGRVVLDPDAAVVAAVRTFFSTFRRTPNCSEAIRASSADVREGSAASLATRASTTGSDSLRARRGPGRSGTRPGSPSAAKAAALA
jgi:DNA invertase Pin-like site-specific DNA recombinase